MYKVMMYMLVFMVFIILSKHVFLHTLWYSCIMYVDILILPLHIYLYLYIYIFYIYILIYIYIHNYIDYIYIHNYIDYIYVCHIPMVCISQSPHVVFEALLRFRGEHCDGVQFLEGHVTHARSLEAKHSFRYGVRGWAKMGMVEMGEVNSG